MVKIAAWSLVLYLSYCVLLFLMQRQMMFPRGLIEVPAENPDITGLERIWIKTSFGKVEAWFLPPAGMPASTPAPVVIFAHGNGELIDFWPDELKQFNHFGLGLLLVEYPGYGRSEGLPSQVSVEETFAAAYDTMAARKDVDASRIILFGRSLGGGAVCALTGKRPSAGLILMSTFINTRWFAARYLVPGFLARDPFENLEAVQNYPGPVLVMHGKFDEVIPYKHGVSLYQAAQNGKMITYESGHNDTPPSWEIFWRDIELFLKDAEVIPKPT